MFITALSFISFITYKGKYKFFISFTITLTFCYALLSYIGALSNDWTRFYSITTLLRQAGMYISFPLILFSAIKWFQKYNEPINTRYYFLFSIFCFIIGSTFEYYNIFIDRADNPISPFWIGGLNNYEIIGFALISKFALNRNTKKIYALAIGVILLFLSKNSQSQIAAILLILYLLKGTNKYILISYTGSIIIFIGTITLFPFIVSDYNTTIRALYWRDALQSFYNTYFIGVGFGGEWITNWYPDSYKAMMFEDGSYEMINTALHNSIISILFRIGLPGIAIIFLYLKEMLIKCSKNIINSYFFCLIFTSLSVNTALESPLFNIGIALLSAYIISDNTTKKTNIINKLQK
jgi:hypothetical protein